MPRRQGPAITRAEVVATAIRLLQSEGPEALGINRVARELGIKPPSLYNHVASNEDLRHAVALEGWSLLEQQFRVALASPDVARPLTRRYADTFRAFVKAHPALYTLMSTTDLSHEPAYPPVANRILAALMDVLSPFGLEGDAALHAVRGLRSALHGFVLLELAGQFPMRLELTGLFPTYPEVDASYEWLIEMLTRGIQQVKE